MDNRNVLNNAPNDITPDLRLLIVGQKRTGRSSVANTILGKEVFNTWGGAESAVAHGESEGRHLMVVDACGWGSDENLVPKQERILERQTGRGLAVVPNHSRQGGLHVNDTLLKLVSHG
nr:Zgc:136870 protein [Danio rerio]